MQSKRYIMLRSARLVNATRHRTEGRSILMDMGAGEMPEDISRVRSDSSSSLLSSLLHLLLLLP